MTRLVVRKATSQDMNAVLALWREMRSLHAEIEPDIWALTPEAEAIFRDNLSAMLRDPRCRVFVAAHGTEIVGYLTATKEEGSASFGRLPFGEIGSLCVASGARRRGVGTRLVAKAMGWFQREGLTTVEVSYATGNPSSAGFWQAHGFRPYKVAAVRPVAALSNAAPIASPRS